ncbi:A mating type protein [Hygrophoropsis aurantiaca]|uniref:A mating type protein n=1 Tax=Hygrophoropsis aurantiaca TaxID=72124 RepID=A0ACB8A4K1_9AGAM|nr:A mating type protein [Hygrophoropsis aurantiaca]
MGSISLQDSTSNIVTSILNIAESILSQPPIRCLAASQSYHRHSPVTVVLPKAQSIRPMLIQFGVASDWAGDLDSAYQTRASELRKSYEAGITRLCSDLAHHPSIAHTASDAKIIGSLTTVYERKLAEWVGDIVSKVKDHISSASRKGAPAGHSHGSLKPASSFNQEYVPLLEHYFEENPFPTRADKDFLAKKSGMEYRQIHVWFQNRRSRTKKEGKTLTKKPMSEGVKLPLDDLYARMERYIIPEKERAKSVEPEQHQSIPEKMDGPSVLDRSAPPHAFPSAYPPICDYNPFPVNDGVYHFEAPQWPRRPSSAPVNRQPAIPMDLFIEKFAHLHVRDATTGRSRQNSQTPVSVLYTGANSFATNLTFSIVAPPAPHPAFIPQSTLTHTSPVHPLPVIAAPTSRLHVFNTPSPQSRLATLVPAAETETPARKKAGRRKIAALPRRIPQGTSIAHRGVTPAASEASVSSPSPSTSSRSPSFGSESSHSRMFSNFTSSSGSSSHVTTPESSPPSLPTQIFSPSASLPGFSFDLPSNMTDLFGDSLDGTPSPVEGLQLDFQSSVFGHSGIVKPPSFNFSCGLPNLVTMRT